MNIHGQTGLQKVFLVLAHADCTVRVRENANQFLACRDRLRKFVHN